MKNTTIATVLAVFLMTGTIGCKTASKMAWWKTSDRSAVESTALAHSAPALPADIAKQAEGLASTNPSIQMSEPSIQMSPPSDPMSTGGSAQPYSAAALAANSALPKNSTSPSMPITPTLPSGYPTTGASPYSTAATAGTALQTAAKDQAANLGSVDMPYNPNAVPPARTAVAATAPATPAVSADRYGGVASASNVAPSYGSGSASRGVAPANMGLASTPPSAESMPSTASTNTPSLTASAQGDRYGNASRYSSAALSGPGAQPSSPTSVNPAAVAQASSVGQAATAPSSVTSVAPTVPFLAKAAPYRPGGTGTYPGGTTQFGVQPNVELASRPTNSVGSAPQASGALPPSTAPDPSSAPRYR